MAEESKNTEKTEETEVKSDNRAKEMREFVKNAYVLLVYCGSERKFARKKLNLVLLASGTLLLMILANVFSVLTFKDLSTYLLLSNVWLVFASMILFKVSGAQRFMEASTFPQKTTFTTITKRNGIITPYLPKKRYRITLALGIVCTVLNIILSYDKDYRDRLVFAIIYTVIAVGAMTISVFLLNGSRNFFGGYYASAYTHRTEKAKNGKPLIIYAVTDKIVKTDVFNKYTS